MGNLALDMLSGIRNQPKQALPTGLNDPAFQNNPVFQQAQSLVNQYGGDPKQAAIALCKQMGIEIPTNPMQMIASLMTRR